MYRNVPRDNDRNERSWELHIKWLRHLKAKHIRALFTFNGNSWHEECRRRHERYEIVTTAEDESVTVSTENSIYAEPSVMKIFVRQSSC